MYIITGGAGFIGSALLWRLNQEGIDDVLIVDNLGTSEKWRNLVSLRYEDYLNKEEFLGQLLDGEFSPAEIEGVVHLGACSDTTERNAEYLWENNYRYTKELALWALSKNIRFIYASSAATYGDGAWQFSDDDALTPHLKPINMYGYSKQLFDLWALKTGLSNKMAGIKFFNVFGPNEYHKGEMRSVVLKAYEQIKASGEVRLFKSHRPEYLDGGQQRDFIYVKDCVDVLWRLLKEPAICGIFNLGTGRARSWNELVGAVFAALGQEVNIRYIDMPSELRHQYQYYTQADMQKLTNALAGKLSFRNLETAVADYVQGYLEQGDRHLACAVPL